MSPHKTITVKGRLYDAVTGLPVTETPTKSTSSTEVSSVKKTYESATTLRTNTSSENVHSTLQHSKTLMRRATKKPSTPHKIVKRPSAGRHMDIARPKSTNVAKFAPHPIVKSSENIAQSAKIDGIKPALVKPVNRAARAKPQADKPPQSHPIAKKALAKAEAKKVAKKPQSTVTAKQIKDAEIAKALAQPSSSKKPTKDIKKIAIWRRRILTTCIILLILAGGFYTVYRLVPSVSVGIASTQAGISAKYPEYVPDGFSLKQPVTYSEGEVDLVFKSNSNDTAYTIKQTRSSWDSTAVLDNIVKPATGENYATVREKGLTIYTYDRQAAWVNGGILYSITGDAALSNDQVRRIATSL